ncbi:unnamed protein product [Heligmosomoides polygyrus]|uniref:Uncharacterized protein n=1 Tax=Heligmosomoides polygyrus TaxID=6339 RepID=A0A183GPL9_HELPZ|nr:unnamed protein product [Heligmosomoides polygyrus]
MTIPSSGPKWNGTRNGTEGLRTAETGIRNTEHGNSSLILITDAEELLDVLGLAMAILCGSVEMPLTITRFELSVDITMMSGFRNCHGFFAAHIQRCYVDMSQEVSSALESPCSARLAKAGSFQWRGGTDIVTV